MKMAVQCQSNWFCKFLYEMKAVIPGVATVLYGTFASFTTQYFEFSSIHVHMQWKPMIIYMCVHSFVHSFR